MTDQIIKSTAPKTSHLHSTEDHEEWARCFCLMAKHLGYKDPLDEEWIATWFANAMMAKHDSNARKREKFNKLSKQNQKREESVASQIKKFLIERDDKLAIGDTARDTHEGCEKALSHIWEIVKSVR